MRKFLIEARIWEIFVKRNVLIYADGLVKITDFSSNSTTFMTLKVPKEVIQEIRDANGRLKDDFTKKLANFIVKNKDPMLSNTELIMLGIHQLLHQR